MKTRCEDYYKCLCLVLTDREAIKSEEANNFFKRVAEKERIEKNRLYKSLCDLSYKQKIGGIKK